MNVKRDFHVILKVVPQQFADRLMAWPAVEKSTQYDDDFLNVPVAP